MIIRIIFPDKLELFDGWHVIACIEEQFAVKDSRLDEAASFFQNFLYRYREYITIQKKSQ